MRLLPLLAAIVLLPFLALAPTAAAAGSGLALSGPAEAVRAAGPATATLDIALTLDGVTCAGNAEVPVLLSVAESAGLRSAALTWDKVVFRIAATTASAQAWTGTSQVGLRVWAQEPSGFAKVMASYALPSNCVSAKGVSTGQGSYTLQVAGPEAAPEPVAPPAPLPPLTQRNQELAYTQESKEIAEPVVSLPLPVLGAIAGMCVGGAVVFYKRIRLAAG